MRNLVLSILLFCQICFLGCFGPTPAVEMPRIAFISADEAWVATRSLGLRRLSGDGVFEKVAEAPEKIEIQSDSHGQVLFSAWKKQTTNGQRWLESSMLNSRWSPTSISFADENVGWVRTLVPLFLTEDGGKTFTQILTTEPGQVTKILAADKDTAYLYGAKGKIHYTKDHGRTWTSRDLGNGQDILAFACREGRPDDCWVGTSYGNVFVTADNRTFQQVQLPRLTSDISVSAIFLSGGNNVFVAGYSFGDGARFGVLFVTNDNGLTWKSINVPNDHMLHVAGFGDTIWLASYRAIYRSTDNGKSWMELLRLPS